MSPPTTFSRSMYTYVKVERLAEQLGELRRFLHELGHETNQGEVAFEFDGQFYRVTDFDAPDR
jgi:hypothetical protein